MGASHSVEATDTTIVAAIEDPLPEPEPDPEPELNPDERVELDWFWPFY